MLPCNGNWKLDFSTSNDEVNDLNIALERIKKLEHQVVQNAAKLDAANKTNVKLPSDLYGYEMKSFSYVFLEYLCRLTVKKFDMLMELGQTIHTPNFFPKFEGFEETLQFVAMDYV